jgi:hypothetical protein
VTAARREGLAWVVALALVATILAVRDYRTHDADSLLYSRISNILARQPLSQWIAPAWPPRSYGSGLFREHPAGLFWPAALVARLGYPGLQAAYAVNAGYQAIGLLLLGRLTAVFASDAEAAAVPILAQLLPVAFVFRVRANHEPAMLVFLLLALAGVEKARTRPAWGALTVLGLVGMLLVKGVAALFGPLVCAAWLLVRRRERAVAGGWLALGLGLGAMALVTLAYEATYRSVTGVSFLSEYALRQITSGAPGPLSEVVGSFGANLAWYGGRWVWFAFPWSLVGLAATLLALRHGSAGREAQGLAMAFLVSALYIGAFSLGARQADRYIFPAYYAAGAAGVAAAARRSPVVSRLSELPCLAPALFGILFVLHVLAGSLGLARWSAAGF